MSDESSSRSSTRTGRHIRPSTVVAVVAIIIFAVVGAIAALSFLYLGLLLAVPAFLPELAPVLVGPVSFLAALFLLLWGSFGVVIVFIVYLPRRRNVQNA